MALSTEFLSTRSVAGLFRVTETTVKRWADEGILPCVRSPGGHRKYRLRDVIGFAGTQGYPISGTLEPPPGAVLTTEARSAIHGRDYPTLSEAFFDEALRADPETLFRTLHYLSQHNMRIPTLADDILRPAMQRIGDLWRGGRLRIDQEHRTSHAIGNALARLSPELHRKCPNGLIAVCACLEGERHDLGLRCAALALETEGWEVHLLGADTPCRAAAGYVAKVRPALFCASFSSSTQDEGTRKGYASVARAVRAAGGKFLAGGHFAWNFSAAELSCDHLARSVSGGISWVREAFSLRPGPRRLARDGPRPGVGIRR